VAEITLEQIENKVKANLKKDTPQSRARAERLIVLAREVYDPAFLWDFDAVKMAENIVPSAKNLASDLYNAVTNPLETAALIGNLGVSGVQNLRQEFRDPNLPPLGNQEAGEQFAKDLELRYGGVDRLQRTLETDPVGLLTDVAGGASLTPVKAVQKGAAAIAPTPVTQGANIAKQSMGLLTDPLKPAMQATATELMESAMKPSTTLKPKDRKALVETVLEEAIPLTSKGQEVARRRIDALGAKIDELIDASMTSGKLVPATTIFRHIKQLRQRMGPPKLEGKIDVAKIDKYVDKRLDDLLENGPAVLNAQQLQDIKQDLYDKVKYNKKRGTAKQVKEETRKTIARGAKDAIAEIVPGVDELNKRQGRLLELEPVLDRAVSRIDNRDIVGIGGPTKAIAGSVVGQALGPTTGNFGPLMGVASAALDSPVLKGKAAQTLYNRSTSKRAPFFKDKPSRTELGLIMSGRLHEEAVLSEDENELPLLMKEGN